MVRLALALAGILLMISTAQARQAGASSVVITTFRTLPNPNVRQATLPVAEATAALLAAHGVHVDICELDTEYGRGPELQACLAKLENKPALVLSLGVSNYVKAAAAHIETVYRPRSQVTADLRTRGLSEIKAHPTANTQAMFCALPPSERSSVRVSTYAGGWICDETALDFSAILAPLSIPYVFMHIPSFELYPEPELLVPRSAIALQQMILGQLESQLTGRDHIDETCLREYSPVANAPTESAKPKPIR